MGLSTMYEGTFEELLSAGAKYVLVAEFEGLVQFFPEVVPKRVDSESSPTIPAGYESACPALIFDESTAFSIEPDRDTGFARGDGVDFILAWKYLEAAGLTTELFRTPSKRARLTADFGHAATVAAVDSTEGWVAGDRAYIGRETLTIGTVGVSSFSDIVRSGLTYDYRAKSASAFGEITDTPEMWRRRFVKLHMHILSPEGRMLDSEWLSGDFHRVRWLGWIEKPPKPGDFGMVLRALPLCRLPAEQVGYELGVKVVVPDPAVYWDFATQPIVISRESNVTFQGEYTGGGGGTFVFTIPRVDSDEFPSTIAGWANTLETALDSELSGLPFYAVGATVELSGFETGFNSDNARALVPGSLVVKIPYNAGGGFNVTELSLIVSESTYWLTPGHREGKKGLNNQPNWHFSEGWPAVVMSYPVGSWLPVIQTSGEGYADLTVPSSGVGMVEIDGAKELIRWEWPDAMQGAAGQDNVRLLHITERGVSGTPTLDIGVGAELKFVSGHDGTPAEILLTLLQSSGTGTRGTYDTLGIGLGYGIPAAYIDVASFARIELNEQSVAAYNDGRATLEELMGGWLALNGLCLTQRRVPVENGTDGAYQLTIVRTEPMKPASTFDLLVTLTPSDIEMGGAGQPDTIEAATEVRVARSGIARDLPTVVPQDVPAIQAMGAVSKDFSAPGMSETAARDAANSRIARGLGQSAVSMRVMPWLNMQGGDIVRDQTRHRASYDWKTGTRAPASLSARVAGERWEPVGGRASVVLLRAGLVEDGLYLALGTTISFHDPLGTYFETDQDGNDAARFVPSGGSIKAYLYNPGREGVWGELLQIELQSDSNPSWVLTAGTLPAWVANGVTQMTLGALGTNDPVIEPAFIFFSAARRWGP